MIKIGIYKITNPLNKVYIGQSVNIDKRFKSYYGLHCKKQYRLHRSLVKYGSENHTFEIIEECSIEDLNCRERHWQDFYEVLGENGLNCLLQECNNISQRLSEETKQRISKTKKGSIYTEEHCNNIGKGNRGKKRTSETKQKMSDIKKGQRSPTKGIVLTEVHKDKISNSLKGIPHSEDRISKIKNGCKTSKRVINTETLEEFSSVRELSKLISTPYRTLLNKLKGVSKNNTPYILL